MKRTIILVMTVITVSLFMACGKREINKIEIPITQAIVNEKNQILVDYSFLKTSL